MPPPSLIEQAIQAVADGDVTAAADRLERVLEQDPDHVVALVNLGQVCLLNREPDRAALHFERASAAAPEAAEPLLGLAKARAAQQRIDEADRCLQSLRELALTAEQAGDAHHLSGIIASARGDWAAAEQSFRAAIALRPEHPLAYLSLHQLHARTGNRAGAVDVLEQLAALAPERPEIWIRLLLALNESGDTARLRRCCATMSAANPEDLELHNLAAGLLLARREYAYAFLAYQAAAAHHPSFDRGRFTALARLEALA